jgi:flagellin-specific chaperone FliS
MMHRLTEADVKRDMEAMDHIVWMLGELKSAWEDILNGNSTKDITSGLRRITDREEVRTHAREMRV